jgi:hypothetical protein
MEKTWRPTTAGILTIIAGALNLVGGIVIAAIGTTFLAPLTGLTEFWWFGAIGLPLIILGIVSIIGGIFAIRRRVWGMALAGAICALFPPPTVTVLGILSIIFIALSQAEFTES